MNSSHMNASNSNAAVLRKGKTVILQETWEHPIRKLRFHQGTLGRVDGTEVVDGRILVTMRFPHQPSITADLPVSLLKPA
jgi:hypothetical protein